jgi:leucyl aminopeptidase
VPAAIALSPHTPLPEIRPARRLPSAPRPGSVVGVPVCARRGAVTVDATTEAYVRGVGIDPYAALAAAEARGGAGEVTAVPVTGAHGTWTLYLVGIGSASPAEYRKAGAALARSAAGRPSVVTSIPAVAEDPSLMVEPFVIGVILGSFGFHLGPGRPARVPVKRVRLAGVGSELSGDLAQAVSIGRAAWLSRTLAAVPANVKNPEWLADQARELADESGLACTVWDEHQLAASGMGGIVAVGRASRTPPRLIRLDYRPTEDTEQTPAVVLVGKGITFDTGGLSIKNGESMAAMKRDMTGGGAVIAAMGALRDVHCPVRVVGLVAAAENAVGGDAVRPGDVVRHGGRTSEVTNTDAEGRLVLADALAYAVAELKPAAIVDIATLTGAVRVALGQRMGGIFANDDTLADALKGAADQIGEPIWRLPLHAEYESKLTSAVADADNAPKGPGAIMAALFLQHFVGSVPWAHLDVASSGDSPTDEFEWTTGPTGFGARLLLSWLRRADPLAGVVGEIAEVAR